MARGISPRGLLMTAVVMTAVVLTEAAKVCDKGWECSNSIYCCNKTITDFFKSLQFDDLFPKRNTPILAHAVDFWDYQSFISAAAVFEPVGFGTTGGDETQIKEVAAFLAHVGAKTSCGYGAPMGGPWAWGLCYSRELSPSETYCVENYLYPCAPGACYYGRGALPVYWNYNYGITGEGLKVDLLKHPEFLEENATLAFQAAIWRWMTPMKKKKKKQKRQPSAHDVFVGNWKQTMNDVLSNRLPGFGATMNVLYGDDVCGQGYPYIEAMTEIISHYQYYLYQLGVKDSSAEHSLDCSNQIAFNTHILVVQ